jgi:OOP family OmpA-OmpF porin
MIKFNKLAMLMATMAVAGSALANGSTTNSDNWRSGQGNMQWKIGNASALCWRTANWTPATAAPGCDGAIAPKAAAPVAVVAPVAAKPAAAPAPMAPKPAAAPAPMAAKPAAAPAPMPSKPLAKRKAKQDRN